ncbi:hypothetical protein ATI61_109305 [Archangium gephyra]|uniref:Uncharacterized protein n=1 Tax=Archangium gephyra TaxID=48 RepID=A0AAC8Q215_9BACT|nr:hypothetical protein [Archangium gephyra]AKI99493.1 Hypothetical protein AA314_01120 [Archangium gephyra]REG27963.1 hypothetical protein ATI61_109305 [Archangium gephyra]
MRLVVSLMCLGLLTANGVARAQSTTTTTTTTTQPGSPAVQTPPAPPPPAAAQPSAPITQPPPPPPPAVQPAPPPPPPPEAQGPAETASERATRYSRFSSGSGGLLLVFTELLSGAVTGGILGNTFESENGAYVGSVVGGLALGTAAAVYQYYVPVERNESLLVAGGAALGFLAGFGYGTEQELSGRDRAVATLLTTQAGIIGVLAATSLPGDVSEGDASLVGMSSLYAFVLTGLVQATVLLSEEGDQNPNLSPTLVAPLLGMGVGGLLAVPFELSASRVFKLTVMPMGVGAVLLLVGTALADGPAVPLSALGGIAATFVITALVTAEDPTPYPPTSPGLRSQSSEPFKAVPVPVLMRSGRRGESLTAGPGLLMRF